MLLMWTNNLSLGIKELDEGNRKLVAMINDLHHAIQDARSGGVVDKEEIEIVLHRLQNYATAHCAKEENLLAKIGYSGLDVQRDEHRILHDAVADMNLRFHESTSIGDATEIMRFIYDWLTNHIYVTDRKFIEHFMKNYRPGK